MSKKIHIGSVLIMGLFLLKTPVLWALGVTPARQIVPIEPGEKKKVFVEVFNETDNPFDLTVSNKDWFVLPANKNFTVKTWMKLHGPSAFTLKPGQRRKVNITLLCPKEAQGELVGMVSFMYALGDSMITPIISVSVYVQVTGTEKTDGEITDLKVDSYQGDLYANVKVKSTGNVHLRPTGNITLLDDSKHEFARIPIMEGDPAYPGNDRIYTNRLQSYKLNPGHYWAHVDLVSRGLEMIADRDFTVKDDGQIEMGQK